MIDHEAIHRCYLGECICKTCKHDSAKCCYIRREYKRGHFGGKYCFGDCPDYEPEEKEGEDDD